MTLTDLAVSLLLFLGLFFYAAGTVGLLRFPDPTSRLHALTKADNLGLAFLALAAALDWGSVAVAAKIAAIWLFAIIAAGTSAQLMARLARQEHGDGK